MVWHNDEPLDFANSVHIFALSRLAKQHVTVVLTGEGSDELFAGYPRYRIPDLAESIGYVPAPLRQLRRQLSRRPPPREAGSLRGSASPDDVLLYNSSYLRPELVAAVCARALRAVRRALPARVSAGERSPRARCRRPRCRCSIRRRSSSSILHRQDKMSMAAGIESRVPFMDYRIVEFANRLPTDCKIRNGTGKAVVKAFARALLPRRSSIGASPASACRSGPGSGPTTGSARASRRCRSSPARTCSIVRSSAVRSPSIAPAARSFRGALDGVEPLHVARSVPLLAVSASRWARIAAVHALYYMGILSLLQAIRLRRRAVVLMYHRVLTDEQRRATGSHPGILVTRDTFARHMAFLNRRFTVLSLEEFAERLRNREPFPDSSCLITFDDGWLDNFENALPILEAERLPAVIFLPVNFIGTDRMFWRETLTLLLVEALAEMRRQPARREKFRSMLQGAGLASVLDITDAEPREAVSDALAPLKGAAPGTVPGLIASLSEELGISVADLGSTDRFMCWERIEAMSRHGITFGGHGAEHRLLGGLRPEEVDGEVSAARTVVQDRVGPRVPAFSYPNGSWSPAVTDAVRRAGFQLAFTTDAGTVSATDDPFTIRRVNISEDVTHTRPLFLARLVGLL